MLCQGLEGFQSVQIHHLRFSPVLNVGEAAASIKQGGCAAHPRAAPQRLDMCSIKQSVGQLIEAGMALLCS
jgi:hypothetical protein